MQQNTSNYRGLHKHRPVQIHARICQRALPDECFKPVCDVIHERAAAMGDFFSSLQARATGSTLSRQAKRLEFNQGFVRNIYLELKNPLRPAA
jgi:hypothetical protein